MAGPDGRVPPLRKLNRVLVHGAGSGPWVWKGWNGFAVDLHAGLDVSHASMRDYADAVVRACGSEPQTLIGWSMGGLVAMVAAQRVEVVTLVLLEPSPPAETQGPVPGTPVPGTFDPEEAYGPFPPGIRARPESALARAERKAGISVPSVPERTLVVYGDEFAEARGRRLIGFYGCEGIHVAGASHWDLVLDPEVRKKVEAWLVRWT